LVAWSFTALERRLLVIDPQSHGGGDLFSDYNLSRGFGRSNK